MKHFTLLIVFLFSAMTNANPLIEGEGLLKIDGETPIDFYSVGYKEFFDDFSMDAVKIFKTIDSKTIEEIIIPNIKDQKLKNELIFLIDTINDCDSTKIYTENEKSSVCRSGLDPIWKTMKTIKWYVYVSDFWLFDLGKFFKRLCEIKSDCQKDLFEEHVLSGDYKTIPSWCNEFDCIYKFLRYRIEFLTRRNHNPKLEILNEIYSVVKKTKDVDLIPELLKMQIQFKEDKLKRCTKMCRAIFDLFQYLNGPEPKESVINKKLKLFKENEFDSVVEFAKMFLMFTKPPFEVPEIEMQKNISFAENLSPNNKYNLLVHLHKFYDHRELAKEIYLNADFVPWPSTKVAISFLLEQNELCINVKKCILIPENTLPFNSQVFTPKIDGIELNHWINQQKSIHDPDYPEILSYIKAVSSSARLSINKKVQIFSELFENYNFVSELENAKNKYFYLKTCAENSNIIEPKNDVSFYKIASKCISEELNDLITRTIYPISTEMKKKIGELLQKDIWTEPVRASNEILKEPELDKNNSVIVTYSDLISKINFDFIGSVGGVSDGTRGTGFQVDQCHVITAAHVAPQTGEIVKYKFDLLGKQNSLIGVVIASGRKDKMINDVTQQKDWSVIKLEHNNALKSKIYFGMSHPSNDSILTKKFQLAGHQKEEKMIHDSDCKIINISIGGFLETNCFGKPGLSGSPIFIESSKDEYEVVGILSRSYNFKLNEGIEKNTILSWSVFLSRENDLFGYNSLSEIQKVLKNDPCSI